MSGLVVEHTPIPGLLVIRLQVHADNRGWFKENWNRASMARAGVPGLAPVQQNLAFNTSRGTTRGFHAEPWDKLVSVAAGRVFGAWVDVREGESFGAQFQVELDPSVTVLVPRGVANSYQTLEDDTAYSYLVNAHWQQSATYVAVNLDDPDLAVQWPIPLAEANISDKDRTTPRLSEVTAMPPRPVLVLGANGQLGRALMKQFPHAHGVTRDELDITDRSALVQWPWSDYEVVINAAAFTAVDAAETPEGREATWATNAYAPALLSRIASQHDLMLVHYSSDYVFDGRNELHGEHEGFAPLGAYGQSKVAGELAARTALRHLVLRTSWLVGDGHNFVRTMLDLARKGVSPTVVDDQFGRLTFASEIARATKHLLDSSAPFGIYNMSNGGPIVTWADIARRVFELAGRDGADVRGISTEEYEAGRSSAPRPRHSAFDLEKIRSTGFEPADAMAMLDDYVRDLL